MSRIRSADTSLEMKVRRYLYAEGYRYRTGFRLRGRPDIVFPGRKIAVFVNGCFWHMHGCRLSSIPSTRRDFWEAKLTGNKIRDMNNVVMLEKEGWKVVTIWECKIEDSLEKAILPLLKLLKREAVSDDNS
jgi:DNA mismatch endonuclease Vsr